MIQEGYLNKFKNKIYGCLCERENDGNWEEYLDSILIEMKEWDTSLKTINYYMIWYKLSSCRYLRYKYFRKTIFDCMALLGSVGGNDELS